MVNGGWSDVYFKGLVIVTILVVSGGIGERVKWCRL